jgi:hypothetical protein
MSLRPRKAGEQEGIALGDRLEPARWKILLRMRAHSGQRPLALLMVAATLTIMGCDGSDAPTSRSDAKPHSTIDVNNLLIGSSDLKEVSGFGPSPPEQCGPMSMLETAGGRTAMSRTFIVPGAHISEAVGIFPDDKGSSSAYKKLNGASRLRCIGRYITNIAPNLTVRHSLESIEVGDAATRNRYRIIDANAKTRGFADFMAIKFGRCVVALLVATEASQPPDKVSTSTTATAASLLSGPCQ